jgi:hypothetical protein
MPLPNVRSHRRAPGEPCKARRSSARPRALRCYSACAKQERYALALRRVRDAPALAKPWSSGARPDETKHEAWTLNAGRSRWCAGYLAGVRCLDLESELTLDDHGRAPRTMATGLCAATVSGARRRWGRCGPYPREPMSCAITCRITRPQRGSGAEQVRVEVHAGVRWPHRHGRHLSTCA